MKSTEKQKVIDKFAELRKDAKAKYKALVKVLLELKNSTPSQKRYYNASIYSPANLSSLEYDVKKLCGITDSDINRAVKAEKKNTKLKVVADNQLSEELLEQLKALDPKTANYNTELKPLINEFATALGKDLENQKKDTLIAFYEENFDKGPSLDELKSEFSKAVESAPEDVKKGLKIRELYPFLNNDDCPDEFHTLTGKMVSAYINWKEGRKEVKALVAAGASNEEIYEVAQKVVADFELNLEIHDELEYYQEHGKILGKHPIFADQMLNEKIETMSTVELTKRQKNLRTYVSRDEKKLAKMEEGEAKDKFAEKVQEWNDELKLVDARLEKIS